MPVTAAVGQSNTKEICLEKLEKYYAILRKPDSRIVEVKEVTGILSTFVDLESRISGRLSDDVKPYQEQEVKRKIDEVN
ncbi:MAG: hypothetical protein R3F44_14320 [Candidatus Competibacteraceae bacterium]